jgi:hypothetical protein
MKECVVVFGEAPALLCRHGHQVNGVPWCKEEDDASSQGLDEASALYPLLAEPLLSVTEMFSFSFPPL